jgi:phosphoribosylglycinamide formyltransferase 1
MKNIAILASGSGTNAENLIKYFKNQSLARVVLVLSNNPDAYVLERSKNQGVPYVTFNRKTFYETDDLLILLAQYQVDMIVLAGFLWLVPSNLLSRFKSRIINIHPALLPKYGGKGMYGEHVHNAVKESGDKESGITIHFVNEVYDSGDIIFQAKCPVNPSDTADEIAARVHALEYEHFPKVVEKLIREMK